MASCHSLLLNNSSAFFSSKLRYGVRDIKNCFKQQQLYVKINGEKCKVLGRLGMYHVTVDITDKNIKINDEVIFEVSPMLVDSSITRDYI